MNQKLDEYDFSNLIFPNKLGQDEMLSLDFIDQHKTLVFFGGCGSGKTHAMTALGIKACNSDYKVKFFIILIKISKIIECFLDPVLLV